MRGYEARPQPLRGLIDAAGVASAAGLLWKLFTGQDDWIALLSFVSLLVAVTASAMLRRWRQR